MVRPTNWLRALLPCLAVQLTACDGSIAVDDDDATRPSLAYSCGAPVVLDDTINSEYSEAGPSLSPDGLTLLFSSDRPGGQGESDLWSAQRTAVGDPWGEPVNLGPPVNTVSGQNNPALSPDGELLVFGGNAAGNYDLWASQAAGGAWSEPWRIDELATDALENKPELSPDGEALYFKRSDSSLVANIWVAPRLGDGWAEPQLVAGINDERAQTDPSLSPDGAVLFFAQGEDTEADSDIYYAIADGDRWRDVRPLSGVNQTDAKDEAFHMGPDGVEAFFVSDRGAGDDRDIYTVSCERDP